MSILASTSLRRVKTALPPELLAYSFHSSCSLLAGSRGGRQPRHRQSDGPSRTRLVKDLTPKKAPGSRPARQVEVAPRQPFQRDAVPHPEAQDRWQMRERDRERPRSPRRGARSERPRDERSHRGPPTRKSPPPPAQPLPPALRLSTDGPNRVSPRKPKVENPLVDEFDQKAQTESADHLPTEFTSPPLMDGLCSSVQDVLGPYAKPTPIQGLAMKHLLAPPKNGSEWRQYLLASETGSGKSLAYLLPMLQDLKAAELTTPEVAQDAPVEGKSRAYNPRALVLAPTHELSRQLSGAAKALLHNIKLRVLCASRANNSSVPRPSTAKLAAQLTEDGEGDASASQAKHRAIDVLVGTPNKVLEMVHGHGWNWDKTKSKDGEARTRKFVVGEPEVGLHRVEWVVVDEADVLFDPDFAESTRKLLADIAAARGQPIPADAKESKDSKPATHDYPFNLVLTSATIPSALASYLDKHHPSLIRLASPNLHHLPSSLKTEHAEWSGGNRAADVEARIRKVWGKETTRGTGKRSKILVFCNRSTRVEEFGKYLTEKGIPNVALTSTAEARGRGSNRHLEGFLRVPSAKRATEDAEPSKPSDDEPHVLITTSLLSRGLDFSPDIKHVLITDPPRNMIDFLHRAGRTGRAGRWGKVVVFGKMKGRGSNKDKEVRSKVRALRG